MPKPIKSIVIAGGGLDGWTAAAFLSVALKGRIPSIFVVDHNIGDSLNGAIGPAISTLDTVRALHVTLRLPENELVRRTQGTFKLGSAFTGFGATGSAFFAPFGDIGLTQNGIAFNQLTERLREDGVDIDLAAFAPSAVAAKNGKFSPAAEAEAATPALSYGLHIDAALYRNGLRTYAMANGVDEVRGRIAAIERQGESGRISSLALEDGRIIHGDLFLDCSGASRILMAALGAKFEDWRNWFGCDRRMTATISVADAPPPYTSVAAFESGWIKIVPLFHATTATLHFERTRLDDENARRIIGDAPRFVSEPEFSNIEPGRLQHPWTGNCIALGEAATEFDDLDSVGHHLLFSGLRKLMAFFPYADHDSMNAAEFNRQYGEEIDRARDMALLHFVCNRRIGDAFWDAHRTMPAPSQLKAKIRLFEARGSIQLLDGETFLDRDWIARFYGHGLRPRSFDPLANSIGGRELLAGVRAMKKRIDASVARMPAHATYLARIHEAGATR